MLAEMLHERGIHRVEAMTDVENAPEQKALARAGFRLEGIARGAQVCVYIAFVLVEFLPVYNYFMDTCVNIAFA